MLISKLIADEEWNLHPVGARLAIMHSMIASMAFFAIRILVGADTETNPRYPSAV